MGKKSKYKVTAPKLSENRNIKFSFEFYDTKNKKYCLSKFDNEQVFKTLCRLKEINEKTFNEILRGSSILHFHQVHWQFTTEKNGFPNLKANHLEAFQFGLLGVNGQKARVFGAYAQDTFFIVWFDLEHEVWPAFKKNT